MNNADKIEQFIYITNKLVQYKRTLESSQKNDLISLKEFSAKLYEIYVDSSINNEIYECLNILFKLKNELGENKEFKKSIYEGSFSPELYIQKKFCNSLIENFNEFHSIKNPASNKRKKNGLLKYFIVICSWILFNYFALASMNLEDKIFRNLKKLEIIYLIYFFFGCICFFFITKFSTAYKKYSVQWKASIGLSVIWLIFIYFLFGFEQWNRREDRYSFVKVSVLFCVIYWIIYFIFYNEKKSKKIKKN